MTQGSDRLHMSRPTSVVLAGVVMLLSVVLAVIALGCGDPDAKCREASAKASYSEDYDEMGDGNGLLLENCTWNGDEPVAR